MVGRDEIEQACALLGMGEHDEVPGDHVVTDLVLLVRTRVMDNLSQSSMITITPDHTDFIALLGMLRWATLNAETDEEGAT